MGKHYVSEVGTEFLFDLGISIGASDVVYINYKKPDGVSIGTWSGSIYSSYSEIAEAIGTYFIRHVLAGTELNQSGEWLFQSVLATTSGTWYGETAKENIFGAFE